MRITSTRKLMLAVTIVFVAAGSASLRSAQADVVDLQQVLHGPTRCDHVIDLMMRHGIHNDQSSYDNSMMQQSPMGPMWIPHEELGDLELIEVVQLPVTDPACGPTFAVVVQNNSKRDVCDLPVTLVALLGRIIPTAPTTVVKVEKICAGQAAEVHVQLPIEALAMGARNGQPLEFARLVVAIDSFDQFAECNEANNVKVFDRASIATRELVQQTIETVEQIDATPSVEQANPVITQGEVQPPVATQLQQAQVEPTQSAPPANDDLMSAINKLDNPL